MEEVRIKIMEMLERYKKLIKSGGSLVKSKL
jgi:hypothetical protein